MTAAAPTRRPVTVIGLTVDEAESSVSGGNPLERWLDRVDAVVLTGSAEGDRSADPTILAAALIARYPDAGWIVQSSTARDQPYNLARRVASVAALSATGAGVLLEATPSDLPGLTEVPADRLSNDGALVLKKLWQSWPSEAVLGDRVERRFVDASLLRRVDHTDVFSVAGPLQLPVRSDQQPIVLQRGRGPASAHADVLLDAPADSADPRPSVRSSDAADLLRVDELEDVFLTGDPEHVAAVLAEREKRGALDRPPGIGLRERLGALPPEPLLLGAPVAFSHEKW